MHPTVNDREEQPGREPKHEGAHQCLKRREQPPRLGQHEIAGANSRVGACRKIERRIGIGQAALPEIEQAPDGNLGQVNQNQAERQDDHQPGEEPEA